MTTGDVVYSLRFSLIKILPEPGECGVPQGSVLGARMYAMYAHPMSNIVNKQDVSYHNYADDTQLYMACDNNKASVMQAVKSLEDCIADISE